MYLWTFLTMLLYSGVDAFILYSTGSSSESRSPAYYSSADSWVSEELWPKEKSVVHIKLIKPLPKEIPIWELRNKDNYLSDISLDFDSPYRTIRYNNCQISFKSYYDGYSNEPNNQEITQFASNIQVEISGSKCFKLPLNFLTPIAINLTHLVVRETAITDLYKFVFGASRLDKLVRLDIISNNYLATIHNRAFDGLNRLSYLSLINNKAVRVIDLESFAGLKSLEELIFIGNGAKWDQSFFSNLLKAVSDKILPRLIHLHLCGSQVNEKDKTEKIVRSNSSSSALLNMSSSFSSLSTKESKAGLKINKDDFHGLTQVKYLQLSDCDINFIHSSALVPLVGNIVGLNLGGNPKLTTETLKKIIIHFYVSNIKRMQMQEERLTNASYFGDSKSIAKIGLDKLDLSYSITSPTVPKDLLTVISKTTITELYMKNVTWKAIKHGDIPPMPNLKVLHIDHNQIEYLDEHAFIGLEELVKLSLKGNNIKQIPLFLLEPMRKLEYLDLSSYRIAPGTLPFIPLNISRKAFVHGTHLKELNLNYKNLSQLQRYMFIGLFKLEKLHMRGCNIKMIEYLTFFPLKSINYIDLSENLELINNVRKSQEDVFVGLEAVEMVRLSYCNLTSEDIDDFNLFKRMHEHVHLLDLSHNRIDLIKSHTLQNFTELRHIDLSHNMIKSWKNYTIFSKNTFITTLDISYNHLTYITPEMLGDFRNLKNLSFASNPLACDCDWEGPLLLLDSKQQNYNQLHHEKIQNHIQQLVHRQQQIVSTAFLSSQIPPKSIIDWLNKTTIHFLRDRHPLRSNGHYFCHKSSALSIPPIVFKEYFARGCLKQSNYSRAKVSFALLTFIACTLLLMTVVVLIIAFIYNSTLRTLIKMVDDDFLHNYQYDAFVSYNFNDSDWVFNELVPSLEEIPTSDDNDKSYANKENNSNTKSHIKLCVYDRDFIAGRPISECITESIRSSRKVILVISNNFALSPWCRFETDLAHNTLLDQNREGLILIKLEEMSTDMLEKVAPQLHFLLKTRIYLSWSNDFKEQEVFWKKLRRALGFDKNGPYDTVKQYYKNYVGNIGKKATSPTISSPTSGHSVVLAPTKDLRVSFRKLDDGIENVPEEEITCLSTCSWIKDNLVSFKEKDQDNLSENCDLNDYEKNDLNNSVNCDLQEIVVESNDVNDLDNISTNMSTINSYTSSSQEENDLVESADTDVIVREVKECNHEYLCDYNNIVEDRHNNKKKYRQDIVESNSSSSVEEKISTNVTTIISYKSSSQEENDLVESADTGEIVNKVKECNLEYLCDYNNNVVHDKPKQKKCKQNVENNDDSDLDNISTNVLQISNSCTLSSQKEENNLVLCANNGKIVKNIKDFNHEYLHDYNNNIVKVPKAKKGQTLKQPPQKQKQPKQKSTHNNKSNNNRKERSRRRRRRKGKGKRC